MSTQNLLCLQIYIQINIFIVSSGSDWKNALNTECLCPDSYVEALIPNAMALRYGACAKKTGHED